jgi:leucyl-tRNA synthetase
MQENYDKLMFRDALKTGFYDLQNARDEYRTVCGSSGMRADLVNRFIDVSILCLEICCVMISAIV